MLNQKKESILKKKIANKIYILFFLSVVTVSLFYFGNSFEKTVTFKYKENSNLDISTFSVSSSSNWYNSCICCN